MQSSSSTQGLKRGIYLFLGVTAALMVIATLLFIAGGGRPAPSIAAAPTAAPTFTPAPTSTVDPNVTPSATPDEVLPTEEEGRAFLEQNATAEGVTVTDSGLQYKFIEKGDSTEHPGPTDSVTVHYRGTFIDGTPFDSSYDRGTPATFPLNQVIDGWTEGLQLASPGDKIMLYVPSNLAYKEAGRPGIPPNATLIFEIEFISIG